MFLSLIALVTFGSTVPLEGDLLLFDADIREVSSEPWMDDVIVVFQSVDYFIGVSADPETAGMETATLLAAGPVDLDEFRLIHLRPGQDLGDLPGIPVFERGQVMILKLDQPTDAPVMIDGAFFVQPLRIYTDRAGIAPFQGPEPTDGYIEDMVAAVSQDSIIATIQHLQDYGTRFCLSPEYDMATAWADEWFGLHWIPCEQQPFYFYGDSMNNVVAEIPGQVEPSRIYVICGHFDSIVWPIEPAPGADDNGSGSAAVLEAARVLARYDFKYTIRFVLFGAEEVGLVGSDVYVSQAYGAGDDIRGVVNLDMILYAPPGRDTLWIPYDANSQALAEYSSLTMQQYVPQLGTEIVYDPSATYSDHASFWQYGYAAILGIEHDVDYNPYYHQTTDLLENYMSYFPFGTNCVKGSIAVIAALAEPIGPSSAGDAPGAASGLRILPNPCGSTLDVVLPSGWQGEAGIAVFDLAGRRALDVRTESGGGSELDLTGLPGGLYAIVCTCDGEVAAARFVKLD